MRYRIFLFASIFLLISLACSLTSLIPTRVEEPRALSPQSELSKNEQLPFTPSPTQPTSPTQDTRNTASEKGAQPLATPKSDTPAAGICGGFEGQWVTIAINPDIPDPRCSLILPDQMLEVINHREETLTVSIGHLSAEIPPGGSHRFELPFGEYLLPGVHAISVQPCCGAELVLGD